MKKLVFFDIDGTLLPEGDIDINPNVVSEIKSIMNDDTDVFICTGRCYHQAKKYIDTIGSDSYICSNGQEVCYKGEVIYNKCLDKKDIDNITQTVEKYNCPWGYETRTNIYIPIRDFTDKLKNQLEEKGFEDIKISNDKINDGSFQIWVFAEQEDVNQIDLVIEEINNSFKAYKWDAQCAEILLKDESKAKGIKIIRDILIKEGNDTKTYAFGDGVNDIDMFNLVDVAVVMGNAKDEIKKHGDIITTACTEDGIKNGLKLAGLK